jgi:hypothetical protein
MSENKYNLEKYLDKFISIPSGERMAFIEKIAKETGASFYYAKTQLYRLSKRLGKAESNPHPPQLTTSESILNDRLLIKSKSAERLADQKYKHLLKDYENLENRLDALLNIKEEVETVKIIPKENDPSKNHATPIVLFSDWHLEETVDPLTINGLNEYNLDIAAKRISNCFQNALRLINIDRNHSEIKNVVVWLGGDMITGFIHEDLMQSNSLSPTQAVRAAKKLIISGLEFLLTYGKFENIHVVCSYGNHGRTGIKKMIANGYKNSYEWMMFHDVAEYFREKLNTKINFTIPNGIFAYAQVYDYTCRFFHGDTIKYQGGIGGLTVPLIKAIHRYNQQKTADYNFLGHYHQLIQATRDCIVNGSVIGFNAYAQSIGASPEDPVQGYCLIDQKRGMTIKAPIFC